MSEGRVGFLVIDEEGDLFWTDELDEEITNMVKEGYWVVVDLENCRIGKANKDWTGIKWEKIKNRKKKK